MRMKTRRLERQARVPLGKYFVITLLAVIFVNCLAFVHAGIVVANIACFSILFCVFQARSACEIPKIRLGILSGADYRVYPSVYFTDAPVGILVCVVFCRQAGLE